MILEMIFKTQVLVNNPYYLPDNPSLADFFKDNPALLKNKESASNSQELFLKSISSNSLPNLFNM